MTEPLESLSKAFLFASAAHSDQLKPGTRIPFIYHPMAVTSLVLRFGGSLAQAQAALLHDTIADGKVGEAELRERFGEEVARLVFAFADPELSPEQRQDWRKCKEAYLGKLKTLDSVALRVVACEELHELSELILDLRYQGTSVWRRYPVHAMEVFWYFRELLAIFHRGFPGELDRALVAEFGSQLRILKGVVFEGNPPAHL